MVQRKTFLTTWIGGLIAFAIVIAVGLPLGITAVPGGILDHQAAGSAATVNTIHAAWKEAGVFGTARTAMIGDLIFIGIYGVGSVLGGLYFRNTIGGSLRTMGTLILAAGVVFVFTDYGETISQLVQVLNDGGSDTLAGIAATLRPFKIVAWLITFFGISVALLIEWRQRPKA